MSFCSAYANIRTKHLMEYYTTKPCVHTFVERLKSDNKKTLIWLNISEKDLCNVRLLSIEINQNEQWHLNFPLFTKKNDLTLIKTLWRG